MQTAGRNRWHNHESGGFGVPDPFNSHPKTVGDLLSRNERAQIVVPEFQRGYSWTREHVGKFWEDIKNFQQESRRKNGPTKYFLGPIVTRSIDSTRTDLLDGQQRLATATILVAALREAARKLQAGKSNFQAASDFRRDLQRDLIEKESLKKFALEMGETDRDYFRAAIQHDPPESPKIRTRSHQNIYDARSAIEAALESHTKGLAPAMALEELKSLEQVVRSDLVMACIPVEEERDAFKIFETLNNRGLRLSPADLLLNFLMQQSPQKDRPEVRKSWTAMIEEMGTRDIHEFLRHLWICRVGDIKSEDLFSSIQRRITEDRNTPREFASSCQDACERYAEILEPDQTALGPAAEHVRNLARTLKARPALPLLLATRTHFPTSLEKVAQWTLVFVVRHSIIAQRERSRAESVLFGLANKVWTKAADDSFKANHLAEIKSTLKEDSPNDEAIEQALADTYLTADTAKYLVRKVADYLQSKNAEVSISAQKTNIEHIFPKRPSQEWTNAEDLERYLWHIGNLTMLGSKLNGKAANEGFEKKRKSYAGKSELIITRQIADKFTEWTPETVRARATQLARAINAIWNFENPSRV